MESQRTPASRRLLSDLKRQAKSGRNADETHSQALERLAREHGYPHWDALQTSCNEASKGLATSPAGHPIDPPLPDNFDCIANELRPESEVNRWWGKPFIITREDGFDVRCLDGGAWDRSTWYGHAKTLEECDEIAAAKLARWQEFQKEPAIAYDQEGRAKVVLMPWRPHVPIKVLYVATDGADANRFLDDFRAKNGLPPLRRG